MSAELLRRAASLMRDDAQLGRTWSGPWHPETALAVADWLDNEAGHMDATVRGLSVQPDQAEAAYTFPLAVARAYLDEDAS